MVYVATGSQWDHLHNLLDVPGVEEGRMGSAERGSHPQHNRTQVEAQAQPYLLGCRLPMPCGMLGGKMKAVQKKKKKH